MLWRAEPYRQAIHARFHVRSQEMLDFMSRRPEGIGAELWSSGRWASQLLSALLNCCPVDDSATSGLVSECLGAHRLASVVCGFTSRLTRLCSLATNTRRCRCRVQPCDGA